MIKLHWVMHPWSRHLFINTIWHATFISEKLRPQLISFDCVLTVFALEILNHLCLSQIWEVQLHVNKLKSDYTGAKFDYKNAFHFVKWVLFKDIGSIYRKNLHLNDLDHPILIINSSKWTWRRWLLPSCFEWWFFFASHFRTNPSHAVYQLGLFFHIHNGIHYHALDIKHPLQKHKICVMTQ